MAEGKTEIDFPFQEFDSGWWNFVFSEEDIKNKISNFKNCDQGESSDTNIDWESIYKCSRMMKFLELEVYGSNHGGLLVQSF